MSTIWSALRDFAMLDVMKLVRLVVSLRLCSCTDISLRLSFDCAQCHLRFSSLGLTSQRMAHSSFMLLQCNPDLAAATCLQPSMLARSAFSSSHTRVDAAPGASCRDMLAVNVPSNVMHYNRIDAVYVTRWMNIATNRSRRAIQGY